MICAQQSLMVAFAVRNVERSCAKFAYIARHRLGRMIANLVQERIQPHGYWTNVGRSGRHNHGAPFQDASTGNRQKVIEGETAG
jgi:hypothetical protein